MTYLTISDMTMDQDLRRRLTACAAQEGTPAPYNVWVVDHIWDLVVAQDWIDAWVYAKNAGKTSIGADESVITDSMILTRVQALNSTPDPD